MNGPHFCNYINVKSGRYFLIETVLKFVVKFLIGHQKLVKVMTVSVGSLGIPYIRIDLAQHSGTQPPGSTKGGPNRLLLSHQVPLKVSLRVPHIKINKIKIAATYIAQNTTLFGSPEGRRLLLKRIRSGDKKRG